MALNKSLDIVSRATKKMLPYLHGNRHSGNHRFSREGAHRAPQPCQRKKPDSQPLKILFVSFHTDWINNCHTSTQNVNWPHKKGHLQRDGLLVD